MMKRMKTLQEMIGFTNARPEAIKNELDRGSNPLNRQITPHITKGLRVSYCATLDPDQRRIVQLLERPGQDVYVQAPTGAGKTGPMICYFAKHHLGVNPELNIDTEQDVKDFALKLMKIILEPKEIPIMLILVPVVKLAQENYSDFTNIFASIITQTLNFILQNAESLHQILEYKFELEIDELIDSINKKINQINNSNDISEKARLNNELNSLNIKLKTIQHEYFKLFHFSRKNIDSTALSILYNKIGNRELIDLLNTREQLFNYFQNNIDNPNSPTNLIADFKSRILILDKNISDMFAQCLKKFVQENLVSMVTGADSRLKDTASMIVATYGSATKIINKLGDRKNNIRFVCCDESHLIQELYENEDIDNDVIGGKDDDTNDSKETQADQIARNLYYVLNNIGPPNHTKLLLMTGTANPESVKDLVQFLNFCYKRNIMAEGFKSGNPASLACIPADWLSDEKTVIERLLVNPRTSNNLIILFGKARTLNMIKKATQSKGIGIGNQLRDIDKGYTDKYEFGKRTTDSNKYFSNPKLEKDHGFNKYYGKNPIPDDNTLKNVAKQGLASEIVYPLQREAVRIGVGFICRMTKEMPDFNEKLAKEYENDFRIVQDLFKKGIVKTIIATDAVGIGVNVDVANMYMLTTEKFGGTSKGYEPLLVSNLKQLLERVGRRAFATATIYAPEKDVPLIIKALNASSLDFEKRRTIGRDTLTMSMCQAKQWLSMLLGRVRKRKK